MKYTIRCLCIAFVFFTGPSLAGGNVFVGGKEWLVPASTGGYSYEQVAAVCPLPSGKCSGTLPIPNNSAVDVTGYYWAFPTDVDELFNSYGTVKKQFFEDFGSGEDKGELLQYGMARASAEDENLAYVTLASYDLSDNMTSMNSTALGIDSESEQQQSWPGFPWLWREAGPYKQKQFVFSIPESPPNPAQAECDEGVALLTKYEFYDIKPNATGKFKISTISTWDKTSKVLDNDVNEIGEILVCQDWQTYWPQRNLVPVYYEITIGGRKYRAMGAGTSPNFPQFDVLPGGLQAMTREGYPEVGVTYLSITATVLPSTEGKVGGMFFTGNLAYVDGVDRDYYDHGGIGVLQILVPHHEL